VSVYDVLGWALILTAFAAILATIVWIVVDEAREILRRR
jgi:hypothetical protein